MVRTVPCSIVNHLFITSPTMDYRRTSLLVFKILFSSLGLISWSFPSITILFSFSGEPILVFGHEICIVTAIGTILWLLPVISWFGEDWLSYRRSTAISRPGVNSLLFKFQKFFFIFFSGFPVPLLLIGIEISL